MSESNLHRNKILRYIYLQPEIDVSIEKINRKFSNITLDELSIILEKMSDDNLLKFGPVSPIEISYTGSVSEDSYETHEYTSPKKQKIIEKYANVTLTIDGREIVEEHKRLFMKTIFWMIAKPFAGYFVAYILGIITPFLLHFLF